MQIRKLEMKILLWGGRSKARIIMEMINELYGEARIVGIFDKTLTLLFALVVSMVMHDL